MVHATTSAFRSSDPMLGQEDWGSIPFASLFFFFFFFFFCLRFCASEWSFHVHAKAAIYLQVTFNGALLGNSPPGVSKSKCRVGGVIGTQQLLQSALRSGCCVRKWEVSTPPLSFCSSFFVRYFTWWMKFIYVRAAIYVQVTTFTDFIYKLML